MEERFPNGQKTLWEKAKSTLEQFVPSSQSFQKVLQTRKNQDLFGKGKG